MNEQPMEHVAVTGMGIVTPIGSTTGIFARATAGQTIAD
jgi:hypothetical protein